MWTRRLRRLFCSSSLLLSVQPVRPRTQRRVFCREAALCSRLGGGTRPVGLLGRLVAPASASRRRGGAATRHPRTGGGHRRLLRRVFVTFLRRRLSTCGDVAAQPLVTRRRVAAIVRCRAAAGSRSYRTSWSGARCPATWAYCRSAADWLPSGDEGHGGRQHATSGGCCRGPLIFGEGLLSQLR